MKKTNKKRLFLGETFEEKKNILSGYYCNYNTLYECYSSYSYSKERVYNYYRQLLEDNADDLLKYGIKNYNTFMITLEAEIVKDNKKYYLLITPSHNYFIEIQ